jgi:hypothetical protein
MKLGVLSFGRNEDGDVKVDVYPKLEKILVGGAGSAGIPRIAGCATAPGLPRRDTEREAPSYEAGESLSAARASYFVTITVKGTTMLKLPSVILTCMV